MIPERGKISLILCFLAFYDTKAAKNITKPQNKVLLWYLRTRKMSQNPKYTAIYDMKWTLEVGQTSGVHLRYRAQIKQRKSDETRESNREAPHPNPCDLEAESCPSPSQTMWSRSGIMQNQPSHNKWTQSRIPPRMPANNAFYQRSIVKRNKNW